MFRRRDSNPHRWQNSCQNVTRGVVGDGHTVTPHVLRLAGVLSGVEIPILGNSQPAGFLSEATNYLEDTIDLTILTVYPDDNIIAWPVRKKINWGDLFDESIIEKIR